MLVVRNIRVRSLSRDYLHVFWQIEDTGERVLDYDFFVLRSGSPSGPYEVWSGALVDTFIWRDNRARDRAMWGEYYYRIRVVHRDSQTTVEYGSKTPEEVAEGKDPGGVSRRPEQNLVANEIIYRHNVLFRAYNGRVHWVLVKRTFGERCSACMDFVKQQTTDEQCEVCYGTGFSGGYFTPIQVLGRAATVRQEPEQPSVSHNVQPATETFFFANYPECKPGDVICEAENIRWRVVRAGPSRMQGALVSQQLYCTRIIKNDIEYAVPIIIDPVRLVIIDERQYTGDASVELIEDKCNRYSPRAI